MALPDKQAVNGREPDSSDILIREHEVWTRCP